MKVIGKISAIITTYKREACIVERAIKSVLCQTYQNIELLIVDDNDLDSGVSYGIQELVGKYEDQGVKYLTYQGNRGANFARNYGLAHADGEFIAYLDDDDEWLPEKTEKQLSKFDNAEVALVYCRVKKFYEEKKKVVEGKECIYSGDVYPQLILSNFIGSTSFALLRTSVVREVGGFDEEMLASQDADLWLRISQKYKVDYVNEFLGVYHVHASERITSNPVKKIQGILRINEKNSNYLQKNTKARWLRNVRLAPYYAANGELAKALRVWLLSALIYPKGIITNVRYLKRTVQSYFKS